MNSASLPFITNFCDIQNRKPNIIFFGKMITTGKFCALSTTLFSDHQGNYVLQDI